MRTRFNDGRYWERALAGEFLCRVDPPVRHRPVRGRSDEVPGSVSIMASFYEAVNEGAIRFVFRCDIVLRPDGSFGGYDAIRGLPARPDPKLLVEDGVAYGFREPTPAELAAYRRRLARRRAGPRS